MKLRPLAIVIFLLSPATAAPLLSPSPPHSVCDHKKTSLSGWLPLPQAQHDSPDRSFSSRGPSFTHASFPQVDYSNSK
jgi:hypothetical protein